MPQHLWTIFKTDVDTYKFFSFLKKQEYTDIKVLKRNFMLPCIWDDLRALSFSSFLNISYFLSFF